MVRFLHTADWQIGMTRHFLNDEAQARFSAARIDAIRKIVELAGERECEFVVVCGDVFESNYLDRKVVVRTLEALRASSVPVYLLPGNHDPINAGSVFNSPVFVEACPENVHVIQTATPIDVSPSVQIIGAPWFSKRPLTDLVVDAIQPLAELPGTVRIVCGHGAVNTLSPDRDDPSLINLSDIESKIHQKAVHFVALGDRHSTTDVGDSTRIYYSGAPEPTGFRENDPGNILIVDLDESNCSVESVKVASWTFVNHEAELNNSSDIDELSTWLNSVSTKDKTIVRLQLVGTIGISDKVALDLVIDNFSDLFASIDIWERRSELAITPDEADFSELKLSGFAEDGLQELTEMASRNDATGESAKDALSLLFRLAGENS